MIRSGVAWLSKGGLQRVGGLTSNQSRQRRLPVPGHFLSSAAPDREAPDADPPDYRPPRQQEREDFFDTLGVQRRFSIDEDNIKAAYRCLMSRYHPDRHTLKPAHEQEQQTERAAAVTRAYDVLTDPHARAEHLLHIAGRPITESDGALVDDGSLLMEVMEIREAVDDATSDSEELRRLLDENRVRVAETCKKLEVAFGGDDLDEAKRLTARLQYWKRIEEKILEKISTVS